MSSTEADLATDLARLDPFWNPGDAAGDTVPPDGDPLTPRELEILASIRQRIASSSRRTGRRSSPGSARRPRSAPRGGIWSRLALSGFAVAAAAVVVAVVAPLFAPTSATALTPPPLEFRPVDRSVSEAVADAQRLLTDGDGPAEPVREAEYVGWFSQIAPDEPAPENVVIVPQEVRLAWQPDLSATQRVTAGTPFWADADRESALPADTPEPGALLAEDTFAAGEFAVPDVAAPGDTPEELLSVLTVLGAPADGSDAVALIDAVDALMSLWTLTDAQQAALLSLVADAEGVDVRGAATDRAGREVLALTATSPAYGGVSRELLISADSGRIVGLESARTTPAPPLRAGDVISYKLWKDEP